MKHKVLRVQVEVARYDLINLPEAEITDFIKRDLINRIGEDLIESDVMYIRRYDDITNGDCIVSTDLIVISSEDFKALRRLADQGAMIYDHETNQNIPLSELI